MAKITIKVLLIVSLVASAYVLLLPAKKNEMHHHSHPHHTHHDHEVLESRIGTPAKWTKVVTGQGEFIFSWDEELTAAFPKDAHEFEPAMHGGFNEDPETGIVYTGIPGYGLCAISADLKQWDVLGSDERLKDNIHGIVFFVHNDKKYLAVAQEGKRVLVLNLDGSIVSDVVKPIGSEFDFAPANEFYSSEESNFGVTDVTYLDGTIYACTGYSKGDFILTIQENEGSWNWGKLAWGGKGDQPGQFQTAHGVYAHDDHILVANRAAGQVVKFTKEGKYVDRFKDIPEKSLVCNVSYKAEHYFFNALSALGDMKSAPIYAHTGDKLVSTIIPGDLDIPVLTNIHHVWPHLVKSSDGSMQLYLLVHGWNKGKFAVLKHEK